MKSYITFLYTIFFISASNLTFGQWELIQYDSLLMNYGIHFFDESTGVVCGQDLTDMVTPGYIIRTEDAGLSWDTVYQHTYPLYDMYFPSDDVGYVCGFNTTVLKTEDGGETWVDLEVSNDTTINWWHHLKTIFFISEDIGYTSKADGMNILLRTDDGGLSWEIDDAISGESDIFFADSENGYMVNGNGGRITHDSGLNWQSFNTGTENRWYQTVSFTDIGNGFVGGGGSQGVELFYNYACIAQTSDSGTNWSNRDIYEMQWINEIKFVNENVGYAIGPGYFSEYSFLKTVDGGDTWGVQTHEDSYLDQIAYPKHLSCVNEILCYCTGSSGRIWKTTNGGGPINYEFPYSDIGEVGVNDLSQTQKSLRVFPNPTSIILNVVSTQNFDEVRIYNSIGELVTLSKSNSSAHEIDVSKLPSGLYMVQVKTNSGYNSSKVLIE